MISLEKTCYSDIDFIASCLNDKGEDFANQCGYGSRFFTYPVTPEQIHNFQQARESSDFFTIRSDGSIIGSFELMLNKDSNTCSVARFLIAEEFRSKGYGTQALVKLSDYAFHKYGVGKVTLTVFAFNTGALKCYTKAGFAETSRETRDSGWIAIHMDKTNEA